MSKSLFLRNQNDLCLVLITVYYLSAVVVLVNDLLLNLGPREEIQST